MRLTVNFAQGELVKDGEPDILNMASVSSQRNVRPLSGDIRRVGYDYSIITPLPFPGKHLVHTAAGGEHLWILCNDQRVYAFRDTTLSEITRTSSLYSANGTWNSCDLNGIPVLTNAVDVPQVWVPANLGTRLTALPNWPSTEAAWVIRSHYNVLIACGLIRSGTEYLRLLKWSHPADPGTLPISWDETDPTKDVGLIELSDTDDNIIDGLSMRSSFIVYKQETTWALEPFSSSAIRSLFKARKLFDNSGIMTSNCACIISGKHFVVTLEDIIVHDGAQIQSVGQDKVKDWFFRNLDTDQFPRTYAVYDFDAKEVYVPFVMTGDTAVRQALVWSERLNKFFIRDLPTLPADIAFGGYFGSDLADTWDTAVGSWDTETDAWSLTTNPIIKTKMLGAGPDNVSILESKQPTIETMPPVQLVERLDWAFGQVGKDGSVYPTFEHIKKFRSVWPRIDAATGTTFQFQFGVRDSLSKPIVWGTAKPFRVGIDEKVDFPARCRYLSYRVYNTGLEPWRMTGMEFDFDLLGIR